MKIAIVGSRNFTQPEKIFEFVSWLSMGTIIISGEARGVDSYAKYAAKEYGLEYIPYPADWDKYGKSAGFRRNAEMVKDCDELVAFWDGKSKGTKHSIELAQKQGKLRYVIMADKTT